MDELRSLQLANVDVGGTKNQRENSGKRSVVSNISDWESKVSNAPNINDGCKVAGKRPFLGGCH